MAIYSMERFTRFCKHFSSEAKSYHLGADFLFPDSLPKCYMQAWIEGGIPELYDLRRFWERSVPRSNEHFAATMRRASRCQLWDYEEFVQDVKESGCLVFMERISAAITGKVLEDIRPDLSALAQLAGGDCTVPDVNIRPECFFLMVTCTGVFPRECLSAWEKPGVVISRRHIGESHGKPTEPELAFSGDMARGLLRIRQSVTVKIPEALKEIDLEEYAEALIMEIDEMGNIPRS